MRDTDWFAKRGWGVFCHYLTSPETPAGEWNRMIDAFDTAGLARQLDSAGAGYFFITMGQGSGHYCAPNRAYDAAAGIEPSKCSERDLIADLYAALHPFGIDLLVYAPADASWADREARRGLGMPVHWSDDGYGYGEWEKFRWTGFMRHWEAVCREWSLRWGSKVRGWWIDGAYGADIRYPEDAEPNLRSFAEALRTGNPDSIVAFNPGVKVPVIHYSDHEDYTAGEVSKALPECPGPLVTGPSGHADRYHVLSYLGASWCSGAPRFPDELVCGYTRHVTGKGGVITWDVPIMKNGLIPEEFMGQLRAVGSRTRAHRGAMEATER